MRHGKSGQWAIALLCLALILGSAGGARAEAVPYDAEAAQQAMQLLQECLADAPDAPLAVAFLGHREADDDAPLEDWLWANAPGLTATMPFILGIPQERLLGGGYGDIYCVVPRGDDTTVAVNHVKWASNGAGVWPEADAVLYRDEYAQPVLVSVGFEEFRDEPDVEIHAVAQNGAEVVWHPVRDPEYGFIILPTGKDDVPLLFDFGCFGDGAMDGGEPAGDDWWLPPTDEGLADTEWLCGERWILRLVRGDWDPDFAGRAEIYHLSEDGTAYQLTDSGQWRMEDDCLRLETTATSGGGAARGSFPVLIDPSGDNLYIMQAREDGSCPVFFDEGVTSMVLEQVYG